MNRTHTRARRPYDAVEVGVVASYVVGGAGGVSRGGDGGGGGHGSPERLQTLLVPHVCSPGTAAVRGGEVQRRAALVVEEDGPQRARNKERSQEFGFKL